MRVTEGDVTVEVPEQADAGVGDEVFFNPVQELNRDLTVAALRALREGERSESSNGTAEPSPGPREDGEERPASREADQREASKGASGETASRDRDRERTPSYLDATAASGIRGVRAAAEGWDATLCDVDPDAVELCRGNLARNGLDGRVLHRDANAVMHEERFDVVDVDPFGTPIPFADAAFRGASRLVCITATDTAPLCGAHFESGVRHYSTVPRNTEYHAEMGLRVLISALVRTAARYDLAAEPVFSHATKHYARTYLRLESGAQAADAIVDELGYVDHCEHCLYREATRGLIADPLDACPECDHGIQTAGPIWLGPVRERAFTEAVREAVDDGMGTAERARDLCETVAAELDEPTHYDQHRLCKRWGVGAVAMDEFVDRLRAAGHAASRTHYGGTTFKTDADVTEIREAAVDGY